MRESHVQVAMLCAETIKKHVDSWHKIKSQLTSMSNLKTKCQAVSDERFQPLAGAELTT